MQRSDFHYDLPAELIAQVPLAERRASRLLVLDGASGALADRAFAELPQLLRAGDLLVLQRHPRVAGPRRGPQADGRARRNLARTAARGTARARALARESQAADGRGDRAAGRRPRPRRGACGRAHRDRSGSRPRAVSRGARADAAAALHRALAGRRRSRALPNGVRPRPGRRGRADGGPALRRCHARRARGARYRAHVFDVARRRRYVRARAHRTRRGARAACRVVGRFRGNLRGRRALPQERRPRRRRRHDERARARDSRTRRRARAIRRRQPTLHLSRLRVSRGRCDGDQFPPARVVIADARLRVRGAGSYARGLSARRSRALPLFQLRRCDARDAATRRAW